jgi:hypothetical protein
VLCVRNDRDTWKISRACLPIGHEFILEGAVMLNLITSKLGDMSMRSLGGAVVLLCMTSAPLVAAPIDRLMDLMKFPEVIELLAGEGRSMADETPDIELGMPRYAWDSMITKLYNVEAMH